jgi:hypothetical protein
MNQTECVEASSTLSTLALSQREVRTIAAALQLGLVRYGFLLQAANANEAELLSHDEVRELRDRVRARLAEIGG